jgi:hypothetical protein
MGWENQPRTPVPRTFPLQKAAVIGGALAMGVAIWLVVSMMSTTVTPVAAPPAALPAPPLVAPAPTAVPTPPIAPGARTPELGPVAEVVAAGSAAPPTRVAVRDPDPAPRRTRAAPATPTVRTVTRTTIEAPPPSPKPERPTRVAVAAPPEPPARSEPVADADLHRPAVAPPPPPPPPQNVTQPVIPPTETSPPAQAAAAPQVVAPTALDGYRIAGDKSIVPDETTMGAISRAGADKLVSSYKVCITAEGAISTVTQLKSTGFPAYDTKIATTIRKDWRYRPYVVNGKATPVCTAFRFIYSQK